MNPTRALPNVHPVTSEALVLPLLILLLPLLILSTTTTARAAAPAAWYRADQVASDSELFARSADELGPHYQELEDALRRLSPAIEELDLAAALGAHHLSPEARAYALGQRTAATRLAAAGQAHVDAIQDGYQVAFGDALDVAVSQLTDGFEVTECESGSATLRMMGRAPRCDGEDLNQRLAKALDQDAELADRIKALNEQPWPSVELAGTPQPLIAVTGDRSFIQLAPLAQALWPSHLEDRSDDLDRIVAPLDEAIASGDADALTTAQQARKAYEDQLATDGDLLIALTQEALGRLRKGAGADVGLCVNPQVLGGCPGTDRSAELVPLLLADRKLQKALAALP